MKVYLKSRSGNYEAAGEYNLETNELIVFRGSRVSESVSSGSFRSAKSVNKLRKETCDENGMVLYDISFKSPSSAANFVTGSSTNGMLAWKDEKGVSIKGAK